MILLLLIVLAWFPLMAEVIIRDTEKYKNIDKGMSSK